jgi:hypothetical protein
VTNDDFEWEIEGSLEEAWITDDPTIANAAIPRFNPETGKKEKIYYTIPQDVLDRNRESRQVRIEAMEKTLRLEDRFNKRYGHKDTPQYRDMMRLRRLSLWMKYICRYLDDAERIDAFDWKKADTYVSPAASGPKSELDRERLVDQNYFHVWSCILQAISEVGTLSSFPAATDAVVCLEALSEMLQPEVPVSLDWKESTPSSCKPADMGRNLVHARSVLRTTFALAISRVEMAGRQFFEETQPANQITEPVDATPRYLGLIVKFDSRTISREGHDAVVDLASKPALWETFRVFYAAENEDAPVEAWKNSLSGEWNSSRVHCSRLRDELAALAITIPDRGRRLVHDGS